MSADPLDRAFGIAGDRVTQTLWEQNAIVLLSGAALAEVALLGLWIS